MDAFSPPDCAVRLLGRFGAQAARATEIQFSNKRIEELLAYLLLFRKRPHRREMLAATLWPESSAAQSRKYLRQSLWQLRALEEESGDVPILQADTEWIQVNARAVWLDVAELEAAYEPVKLLPGERMEPPQAEALKRVVPLYRGDLLEGCYQDWCIYERERLKAMYLGLLDKLLGYCEAQAHHEEGLTYGEELLRHERAHERAHSRLMRLHYLAGDRTAALRQFEQCRIALAEELQATPGVDIRNLHEQIRTDLGVLHLQPLGPAPAARPAPSDATGPLEEALRALRLAGQLLEQALREARQP